MAQAKIDQNYRRSLLAVLDDGSFTTEPVRANPINKRLLVSAVVTSNNTGIGNTIPGGTPGSVLFLDIGSTLAEDNANFFYDPATQSFGLGTNTPTATLNVLGTVRFDLGGDATGDIFYRDSSGNIINLPIGADSEVLTVSGGLPVWATAGTGTAGYDTVQDNGSSVTQRNILNFVNYFTVLDGSGKTNISINTTELAGDTNLITGLLANNTFMTGIASNTTFLSNLNLSNISGQINLSTQVSGTLGVGNGGTGATTLTGVLVGNGTSPVTATSIAQGDLFYGSATGVLSKLAKNTSATRYLSNTGTSNNPAWAQIDLTNGVTGVLPITNGGFGSALSDPGANKLMGWDDTDNAIGFWTLGSGLSYDHATATISVTQNTNLYTIPDYNLVDTVFGKAALELSDGTFYIFTPLTSGNATGFVNYSISPDKTKVYKLTIAYTSGSNYNLTLEEYTGNGAGLIGTLANTYTGSGSHTVGNNNYSGALFVDGTRVFVPLANSTATALYTQWTISGASLTSPVTTNLGYEPTNTYNVNCYWFSDGTYYYLLNQGGSGNVRKVTYSAGTFSYGPSSSGISSLVSTQSYSLNTGIYNFFVKYFKISGGKVVNFTSLKTSGSTIATPVLTSGVLLANNVTAP